MRLPQTISLVVSGIEKLQESAQIKIEKPYDTTCRRQKVSKSVTPAFFNQRRWKNFKSIYGDKIKVVVAETPATTKVALLILLNV